MRFAVAGRRVTCGRVATVMKLGPRSQLRMVWPAHRLRNPPTVLPPLGYTLRLYRPGDEEPFYRLMALAGWPGWDQERLRPWQTRMLPGGWFLMVHEESGEVVATAMALRDQGEFGRPGGELGWLACVPAHRGRGLGLVVSAAVTSRLIEEGYRHLHLYTEDWRLAAIKTYLKLGYRPFLYLPEMVERWRVVCGQLGWPFTPEVWEA